MTIVVTQENKVLKISNWLPEIIEDIMWQPEQARCDPEHFSDLAKRELKKFREQN